MVFFTTTPGLFYFGPCFSKESGLLLFLQKSDLQHNAEPFVSKFTP